ncbi:MAG: hypothetical protein LBF80_06015 [Spirochaetaceae bacterium]|jgi:hypothetical protein|nr:hypothetical protein [Spirochaetaceae bacterium]
MIIIIDGNVADISFENEKTLSDVLAGLDRWARDSGFCLTRVSAGGTDVDDSDALFDREIKDIPTLTVETTPFPVFYREALELLSDTLRSWTESAPTGQAAIEEAWRKTPAASFLAEYDNYLSNVLHCGFSGDSVKLAMVMVRERIEEAGDPAAVFLAMEDRLNEEAERLLDLPLDLQTGCDKRAAETIERFSDFTGKILRLFMLLKCVIIEKPDGGDMVLRDMVLRDMVLKDMVLIDEFNSALREFLSAYENKDMVLSGDLAEYEIAPRIKSIYAMIKSKLVSAGI